MGKGRGGKLDGEVEGRSKKKRRGMKGERKTEERNVRKGEWRERDRGES